MAKTSTKSVAKTGAQNKPETEQDNTDIFDDNEYAALPDGMEKQAVKRDARRKIEIYWEKRRLKEEFDDFDESEFGF
ncbi:conserved hypothetical protein [Candidatus Methylobacter favarea]|uniref:Uncharacterized protein n=1 Tax=Candidatus Methylobacter favarea TaxID=2707345 RepID=A0A8S0YAR3_9GAMM|nr:hypothetical protein [Candidatus Methylobacter favarea]CAA9892407.1 conserved hypothetical protein [Candidatus Methylobacter favarea]